MPASQPARQSQRFANSTMAPQRGESHEPRCRNAQPRRLADRRRPQRSKRRRSARVESSGDSRSALDYREDERFFSGVCRCSGPLRVLTDRGRSDDRATSSARGPLRDLAIGYIGDSSAQRVRLEAHQAAAMTRGQMLGIGGDARASTRSPMFACRANSHSRDVVLPRSGIAH